MSGRFQLVPDIEGNDFSFSPSSMVLVADLPYMAFIMLKYVPCILLCWIFVVNGCWILSKAVSASIEMIASFYSLIYVYHIDWLMNIELSLCHWCKSHLIMVHNLLNLLLNLICWLLFEGFCICIILTCKESKHNSKDSHLVLSIPGSV